MYNQGNMRLHVDLCIKYVSSRAVTSTEFCTRVLDHV